MTTTNSKFDDADLGEMLYIAVLSKESGFKSIQCDTGIQIDLLTELTELRAKAKESNSDKS